MCTRITRRHLLNHLHSYDEILHFMAYGSIPAPSAGRCIPCTGMGPTTET